MDMLARLILRMLLVPLGIVVAACVSVLVVIFVHWQAFMALLSANPEALQDHVLALLVAGPLLVLLLAMSAVLTLLPAAIGVLIAEAFAIRSWIFHTLNGGLSAWVGWSLMHDVRDEYGFFNDSKMIVAAGLAAGLAYWLVAGWTAGFWKPISAVPAAPMEPTRSA